MKLRDYLDQHYTSDRLRDLGRDLLDMPSSITLKLERIEYFESHLLVPDKLKAIWGKLDAASKKAVSAAVYNDGGFDSNAFIAQYGQLPERPTSRYHWRGKPILFDLFVYAGRIPDDMLPLLAKFVPQSKRFQLEGSEALSETFTIQYLDWSGNVRKEAVAPLSSAETERIGWTDLLSYLRLLERSELTFTSTGLLNARSVQKVLDVLVDGEFFDPSTKFKETIRVFGLAQFVDQCGFGWRSGVSKKGREFLQTRDPELLLEAFEKWSEEGSFDELTRIDAVKKLRSRKTRLTKSAERRSKIIEALSWCPTDVWIDIDDFYRAVIIWQFDFDVENPNYESNITFGHNNYWSDASDYWRALKGLSINVVIWEYLAALGAVDIAYLIPADAHFSLRGHYSEERYSQYDGLRYFRINPLGAYLLGQADEYVPSEPEVEGIFRISADKQLTLLHPNEVTPDRQMMLDLLAPDGQLTHQHILSAVEQGYDFPVIHDFLSDNHNGALPAAISEWLQSLEHNRKAFKVSGSAVYITVSNKKHMELMKSDSVLQKFCTPIDNKRVVVAQNSVTRVQNRLKELAFLLG